MIIYLAPELKCWEGDHALYFYAVGVPHVVLYVLGLPIIAGVIIYTHRKKDKCNIQEYCFVMEYCLMDIEI